MRYSSNKYESSTAKFKITTKHSILVTTVKSISFEIFNTSRVSEFTQYFMDVR